MREAHTQKKKQNKINKISRREDWCRRATYTKLNSLIYIWCVEYTYENPKKKTELYTYSYITDKIT